MKELRALRGYFAPSYEANKKVAFHQYHLVVLIDQLPRCKSLVLINPYHFMVKKWTPKWAAKGKMTILDHIIGF